MISREDSVLTLLTEANPVIDVDSFVNDPTIRASVERAESHTPDICTSPARFGCRPSACIMDPRSNPALWLTTTIGDCPVVLSAAIAAITMLRESTWSALCQPWKTCHRQPPIDLATS